MQILGGMMGLKKHYLLLWHIFPHHCKNAHLGHSYDVHSLCSLPYPLVVQENYPFLVKTLKKTLFYAYMHPGSA